MSDQVNGQTIHGFSVRDFAKATSLGRSTVNRMAQSGHLPAHKWGDRWIITITPQEFLGKPVSELADFFSKKPSATSLGADDPFYPLAVELAKEGMAYSEHIKAKFRVGHPRAQAILSALEEEGYKTGKQVDLLRPAAVACTPEHVASGAYEQPASQFNHLRLSERAVVGDTDRPEQLHLADQTPRPQAERRLSLRLPYSDHQELKLIALNNNTTCQAILEGLVADYLLENAG